MEREKPTFDILGRIEKGVMIWALSQQPARRNCSTGEDAGFPQLDGKTPWSFTVA